MAWIEALSEQHGSSFSEKQLQLACNRKPQRWATTAGGLHSKGNQFSLPVLFHINMPKKEHVMTFAQEKGLSLWHLYSQYEKSGILINSNLLWRTPQHEPESLIALQGDTETRNQQICKVRETQNLLIWSWCGTDSHFSQCEAGPPGQT